MTGLLIVISTLLGIGYLALGRRLGIEPAARHISAKLEQDRRSYPSLYKDPVWANEWHETYRNEAVGVLWSFTFLWPVLTILSLIRRWDLKTIDRHDPVLRERLVREQAKRIAELERELGIG